jgi:catechol 2,3-dioxygenase-like lactoylglutathione lyase family enzyme
MRRSIAESIAEDSYYRTLNSYNHIHYLDCPHFTVGRVDQWGEQGYLLFEGKVYVYEEDRKEQCGRTHSPTSIYEFLAYAKQMQIDIPDDFRQNLAAGRSASEITSTFMNIKSIAPQLRTTDMASTIRFYTEKLGFTVDFNYQDFYAGIRVSDRVIHLKRVDAPDPSIPFVDEGGHLHIYFEADGVADLAEQLRSRGVPLVQEVCETQWGTREFVIHDDQGHTLYFGEPL